VSHAARLRIQHGSAALHAAVYEPSQMNIIKIQDIPSSRIGVTENAPILTYQDDRLQDWSWGAGVGTGTEQELQDCHIDRRRRCLSDAACSKGCDCTHQDGFLKSILVGCAETSVIGQLILCMHSKR
jgi:hypothetical protein